MKGIPMDLNFIPPHMWAILVLGVVAVFSVIFYNVGWDFGASHGYELAKTELANKAIAYVAPQVHQRVTGAMTEGAIMLKALATEIEKRTWPDVIQSEMETLAKLYGRAVIQLESHEINDSARRFLEASRADIQSAWERIDEDLGAVTGALLTPGILNTLDQMRRDGYYKLVFASNFLSAALMLEENGFGEAN